jgi:[acyl-carrier-protein] S-malonyltransferase
MGTDLQTASTEAKRLFALADEITGLPITRLCAEGPLERLTETDVAQPAVVVTSLAALSVLRASVDLQPGATAGHSVGEIAAYVAAGVLSAENALQLVHARAQAMASACQAVDGTMAAVIGLDEEALRAACAAASQNGSSVEVANFNAPGQLIVSGARDAIDRATVLAFHRADVPVVLNASAEATPEPEVLGQELVTQVYSPVRWIELLLRLAQLGCDRCIEVGPGQVLAGMVRRTLPDVKVASFGSLADLPGAVSLIEA